MLLFFFCFSYCVDFQKKTKKKQKQKMHKRKNPEAVKWISGNRTTVHCRCICHRHTLIFGIQKACPLPIGARKIDGLPKAYGAELLVTKQDPNSCDRVGQKSHKFGGNVSELLKYC